MQKINVSLIFFFVVAIVRAVPASSVPSKQITRAVEQSSLQGKEAFVNVPMVFDQSIMGKELHQEMVTEARKFQESLRKSQENLEKQDIEIDRAKKDLSNKAAVMSPDAIRQEEKKIAQLERDLLVQKQDLSVQVKEKEDDFQMMAAKKEQSWAQEFQQVITTWAEEEKFEKVWDEVSGRPLYVDNKLKHTDEIIACMNKKSSDKKSASVIKDSSVKKV